MNLTTTDEADSTTKQKSINKTNECYYENCDKSFRTLFELKRHIEAHIRGTTKSTAKELISKQIYACQETGCGRTFTRKWSLSLHQRKIHSDRQNIEEKKYSSENVNSTWYKCDEGNCGATFALSDRLEEHKLTHQVIERPFICDVEECDKSYRNNCHLNRHKMTAHFLEQTKQQQQVSCGIDGCAKTYCNKYVLKQHIDKVHMFEVVPSQLSDGLAIKCEPITKPVVKKRSDIEKRHKCEQVGCDAAFMRPYRLKYHKITHHGGDKPFKCDFPGCNHKYTSNSHLVRHRLVSHFPDKVAPDLLAFCEKRGCGKVFKNKYNLKKHTAIKHVDVPHLCHEVKIEDSFNEEEIKVEDSFIDVATKNPYKCSVLGCVAAFTRSYQLKNHCLNVHGEERPFICDHDGCDKSYKNVSHLTRHKITSHCPIGTGLMTEVTCGVEGCARIFFSKYSLRKHTVRSHGDHSFSCTECDEKFKSKKRLRAHKYKEHQTDAPFKCAVCPKTFVCFRSFERHLGHHKIHQCNCDKMFDKWSKLVKHRSSECPAQRDQHTCETCGKGFFLRDNLALHRLRVHKNKTEINMYKCPFLDCKKSYKYSWNLDYHIKCHKLLPEKTEITDDEKSEIVYPEKQVKDKMYGKVARKSKLGKNRRDRKVNKTS